MKRINNIEFDHLVFGVLLFLFLKAIYQLTPVIIVKLIHSTVMMTTASFDIVDANIRIIFFILTLALVNWEFRSKGKRLKNAFLWVDKISTVQSILLLLLVLLSVLFNYWILNSYHSLVQSSHQLTTNLFLYDLFIVIALICYSIPLFFNPPNRLKDLTSWDSTFLMFIMSVALVLITNMIFKNAILPTLMIYFMVSYLSRKLTLTFALRVIIITGVWCLTYIFGIIINEYFRAVIVFISRFSVVFSAVVLGSLLGYWHQQKHV